MCLSMRNGVSGKLESKWLTARGTALGYVNSGKIDSIQIGHCEAPQLQLQI